MRRLRSNKPLLKNHEVLRKIVALPVHDAIVVPTSSVPEVRKVMERLFEQHTGVPGVVRNEGRD